MAVAGRVITGFSKPHVALYGNSGGTISYTSGQILARGVSVSFEVDDATDDNKFYADNILAESVAGQFGGGTVTLTVDGLFTTAEKLIMGLPTEASNWTDYNDDISTPYCGVGFVVRYMSEGSTSYVPVWLNKVKFKMPKIDASTQAEEIDWQTQELTAAVMRDDSSKHCWMRKGTPQTTEASAEALISALYTA